MKAWHRKPSAEVPINVYGRYPFNDTAGSSSVQVRDTCFAAVRLLSPVPPPPPYLPNLSPRQDYSGNGYNPTLVNSATLTGSAILLASSSNQYLHIPSAFSSTIYQLTSWTVATWLYANSFYGANYRVPWLFGTFGYAKVRHYDVQQHGLFFGGRRCIYEDGWQ